jgi:peptidoglycan/LPS O-acetylase OafA/YrhL
MNEQIKFIPALDGLRAIAVLSVIFYHISPTVIKGGYIGVDIFFVISGFLITRLIINQLENGNFSFFLFYERRIRRILPALFLIILFSLFFSSFFFDYVSFLILAKNSIAVLFLGSNIWLSRQAGYFDTSNLFKPLMHTWSLSIEEQFYLIFPILLFLSFKVLKYQVKWVCLVLVMLSLFYFVRNYSVYPTNSFYYPHARAWELLLGACVFLFGKKEIEFFKNFRIIDYASFFCLLWFILFFDANSSNFEFLISIPVMSTGILIYNMNNTIPSKLIQVLSNSFFVFVGKISYSLYLWHWVLYSFFWYIFIRDMSLFEILIYLALLFPISYYSWKYIELTFRYNHFSIDNGRSALLFISMIFIFLTVVSIIIIKNNGFVERFSENQSLIKVRMNKIWIKQTDFERKYQSNEITLPFQKIGDTSKTVSFLIIGDSYARALAVGFDSIARVKGFSGILICKSYTPPLMNVENFNKISQNGMFNYNEKLFNFIKNNKGIKNIYITSRWNNFYVDNLNFINPSKSMPLLAKVDSHDKIISNESSNQNFIYGLTQTLQFLRNENKNVYLFTTIPEMNFDPGIYVGSKRFKSLFTGNKLKYNINENIIDSVSFTQSTKSISLILDSLCLQNSTKIIQIKDELYKAALNNKYFWDKPLFVDQTHLSVHGAIIACEKAMKY